MLVYVVNLWGGLMLAILLVWDQLALNIYGEVLFSMVVIGYLKSLIEIFVIIIGGLIFWMSKFLSV